MASRNISLVQMLALVNDLVGDLATATVDLMKDNIDLSPTDVVATYTPHVADFTGYAQGTITASTAAAPDTVNGGAFTQVPTVEFAVGATPTVLNTIYGFWIATSGGSPALILSAKFANPVPMNLPLAQLNLDVLQNLFGANGTGADPTTVVVNGLPA